MKLDDQELLFSIFHDGSVENIRNTDDAIELTVDIMYLAELIKPQFTGIIVQLMHPAALCFEDADSNEITSDLDEMNKLDFEILAAESSEDKIKVSCGVNCGQSFGFLHVKANEIRIYDPEYTPISFEYLKTICKGYWDDFGNQSR